MAFKDPRRQKQLQTFIQKLGISEPSQINWLLLDLALTDSTISATDNYEQLEFIGDSVVRLAASEFLWETYPSSTVGEFSAIRKVLVSDRTLAEIAKSYGFERYLLMSNSAAGDKVGEASRLADAFEAVLGALYLSTRTLELIRFWLDPHFQRLSTEIRQDPARLNYKEALQEWTQAYFKLLPEYRVRETSPVRGHAHRFIAEVWIQGNRWGEGTGHSKKAAEQAAAKEAFLLALNTSTEKTVL